MRHATFRQLEIFEAIARHLSFTRAAETLHLTQPTVSMQMKKLADGVGEPLVHQTGKRIELTETGQALAVAARDIFTVLERFEDDMAARRGLRRGRLRLAAVTTASYFAPRLLGEFARLHPGIEVSLRVCNREQLIASLNEHLDELYILGTPPEDAALVAHPFMENPLVAIAAPDHPLAGRRGIGLAELAEQPWLLREPGSGTRKAVEKLFAEHELTVHPRLELGSNEAIKQAVLAGLGISALSKQALELHPPGQFAILDAKDFPIRRHWFIARPVGAQHSAAASAFEQHLLAARPTASTMR
ncbi:MAG TPA: LysR family transcriptional regulator [Azoarcus taiwanensis]|nr:LysR family transcriptional regulator [Azoarcus taiwanensis]